MSKYTFKLYAVEWVNSGRVSHNTHYKQGHLKFFWNFPWKTYNEHCAK